MEPIFVNCGRNNAAIWKTQFQIGLRVASQTIVGCFVIGCKQTCLNHISELTTIGKRHTGICMAGHAFGCGFARAYLIHGQHIMAAMTISTANGRIGFQTGMAGQMRCRVTIFTAACPFKLVSAVICRFDWLVRILVCIDIVTAGTIERFGSVITVSTACIGSSVQAAVL